jgi:hypothetical protein
MRQDDTSCLVLQDDTLNWSPTLEPLSQVLQSPRLSQPGQIKTQHILSPVTLSKESMSFFVCGSLNQKERQGKIVPVLWKKGNTPRQSLSPPGQQPHPSSRTENSVSSIREEGTYDKLHQEGCLQELSGLNTSVTSDNSGQTRRLRPERLRKRCLKDTITAGGDDPLSRVNVVCLVSVCNCFAIVFHAIVFIFALSRSGCQICFMPLLLQSHCTRITSHLTKSFWLTLVFFTFWHPGQGGGRRLGSKVPYGELHSLTTQTPATRLKLPDTLSATLSATPAAGTHASSSTRRSTSSSTSSSSSSITHVPWHDIKTTRIRAPRIVMLQEEARVRAFRPLCSLLTTPVEVLMWTPQTQRRSCHLIGASTRRQPYRFGKRERGQKGKSRGLPVRKGARVKTTSSRRRTQKHARAGGQEWCRLSLPRLGRLKD